MKKLFLCLGLIAVVTTISAGQDWRTMEDLDQAAEEAKAYFQAGKFDCNDIRDAVRLFGWYFFEWKFALEGEIFYILPYLAAKDKLSEFNYTLHFGFYIDDLTTLRTLENRKNEPFPYVKDC